MIMSIGIFFNTSSDTMSYVRARGELALEQSNVTIIRC